MGSGIDFPLMMKYTDTENENGRCYFYFLNGHGNVTYFSDANFTAEQTENYEYTPWGVLLTPASKSNLLYTSREFDFETGLQFNRMQYYNPNLERFISKDYLINHDFMYVKNLPDLYTDPMGLSIFGDIWRTIKKVSRIIWGFFSSPIEGSHCAEYCLWHNPDVQCYEQCIECCKRFCPSIASPEYALCVSGCAEGRPDIANWFRCPPPATSTEEKK